MWVSQYSKYTIHSLFFTGNVHRFGTLPEEGISNFGVPYDYDSILHFGPCAFTRNGLPTIEPKVSSAAVFILGIKLWTSGRIFGSSIKP